MQIFFAQDWDDFEIETITSFNTSYPVDYHIQLKRINKTNYAVDGYAIVENIDTSNDVSFYENI